jgi:sugar lactone lactonase YvrE
LPERHGGHVPRTAARLAGAALIVVASGWPAPAPAQAEPAGCEPVVRSILPPVRLPVDGPLGIAIDGADGSLWISSAISSRIHHLGQDLELLGSFATPFPDEPGRREAPGIAYNPLSDALLLVQPILKEVWEVDRSGAPTGLVIPLAALERPPNVIPETYAKGIAFDPDGDGGQGSIWIVETVLTRVYELALDGRVLASFCHPDDPDGCPGEGRAAQSSDVQLLREGAVPVGLEIVGGRSRRDRIHRMGFDGEPTGVTFPLDIVGGRPGGFARGQVRDPASGLLRDALFVTVESSAELHVLETVEPAILPVGDLEARAEGPAVTLSWKSYAPFDRVEVRRDGVLLATLPGEAEGHTDTAAPPGLLDYEVAGSKGDCRTSSTASAMVGPGQVLRRVRFAGLVACGITEDGAGFLWVTDLAGDDIHAYTKDLEHVVSIPSPFQEPDSETTAIAYDPVKNLLLVYDADTNRVAEMNDAGEVLGGPFPSGVPTDPEDKAFVTSMLFDPDGAGGDGSFWYLDFTRSAIEERTRAGDLLRSCVHPDQAAEPPPERSPLDALAWGMTRPPGGGFDRLDLTGGRVRDLRTTRIFRFDLAACAATGEETPVEGVQLESRGAVLGIHATLHDGRPVIYATDPSVSPSQIFELDASPVAVPAVSPLSCAQESDALEVTIEFSPPAGPIDSIEVLRDGAVIATIPGSSTAHVDTSVTPGVHDYAVRTVRGAERSDERTCRLRVGTGSIAARGFAHPAAHVHAVAPDPVAGGTVSASRAGGFADSLYRHADDLSFAGEIPSPFRTPRQAACLAVRAAGGAAEIHVIGWNPGAPPGTQREFPVSVIDGTGRPLRTFTVTPPPPRGGFVSFPSGLAWDAASDTFWCLERNAFTVFQMSLTGEVLESFPHPAPPHQDLVINYGLAVDGARGVLYLSTSGTSDFEITKLVEVTFLGAPTGFELPLTGSIYDRHEGFAIARGGGRIVVASNDSYLWDMVEYRAFDAVAPVTGLGCAGGEDGVRLAWTNAGAYDAIAIHRGTEEIASIPGAETSYHDPAPPSRGVFYRVVAVKGALSSAGTVCLAPRPFIRGDVEENGQPNITDAIAILGFLFSGGNRPDCLDAADVDDDGTVNITDAISLLNFLFVSGDPPEPPHPEPGFDPTEDGSACVR